MKTAQIEKTGFLEIEYSAGPQGNQYAVHKVQRVIQQVLGHSSDSTAVVQAAKCADGTTGAVQVRCSKRTGRWDIIKNTLHEHGLLEGVIVYQHHPALKCRTQIWP